MNNLITVEREDIKFLKDCYGYTLLNKGKYKLQNSPKNCVWEVETRILDKNNKESVTKVLYKKLENAIHCLTSSCLEGIESYSGKPAIPKVLNDNHIYIYGINREGTENRMSITAIPIF